MISEDPDQFEAFRSSEDFREAAELARVSERFYRPRNTKDYPYRFVVVCACVLMTATGRQEFVTGDVINPGLMHDLNDAIVRGVVRTEPRVPGKGKSL